MKAITGKRAKGANSEKRGVDNEGQPSKRERKAGSGLGKSRPRKQEKEDVGRNWGMKLGRGPWEHSLVAPPKEQ